MGVNTKHDYYETPTYKSWHMMKQRCKNPNHDSYINYGGRGITYDLKWELFTGFFEDMGERPIGLTLDRIDVNKGYFKENCKWSSENEQAYNKNIQHNNTSGKTGVSWMPIKKKWRVRINVKGVEIHLGLEELYEDAVFLREEAEIKYYGKLKGN